MDVARVSLPSWTSGVDAIVPVPLHPARLRERGFNQSMRLARGLFPGCRIEPSMLARKVDTRPQAGLRVRERERNVRGAFCASGRPGVERVLLVDDIYTTGATAAACSASLLDAGVREVYVLTVARA